MSFPSNAAMQPKEYTCVFRLVNCFIAAHVTEKKKQCISKHPETEIKIAQEAAKLFAQTHKIVYDEALKEADRPIITVYKHGGKWYPTEMHPDKFTILTSFGPISLGGNQSEATNMGNVIALSKGADFIPSIGISLVKE